MTLNTFALFLSFLLFQYIFYVTTKERFFRLIKCLQRDSFIMFSRSPHVSDLVHFYCQYFVYTKVQPTPIRIELHIQYLLHLYVYCIIVYDISQNNNAESPETHNTVQHSPEQRLNITVLISTLPLQLQGPVLTVKKCCYNVLNETVQYICYNKSFLEETKVKHEFK